MQPHEILVQIKAAGYCHTDMQVLDGVYESAGAKPGLIGSHEPAGIVVKAGADASKSNIQVGDRVGSINTFGFCGKCALCKRQGKQLCENIKGLLGLTVDGGFAQYMKADARVVSKIPESIPFAEAAPLFCAGATAYGGILRAGLKKGSWVAMIGIGGLGHIGIQYAKAMGLNVIAIDNRKEGIAVAKDVPQHLQADRHYLVDSDEAKEKVQNEVLKQINDQTNPGCDGAIIYADGKALVQFAQSICRKGSIIVDIGLPDDGPLAVDPFPLSFAEQTVAGRLICTPEQCQDMINMHAEKGCRVHIEKTYSVEQMNELYEHYKSKKLQGRVVMTFE